MCQFLWNTSNSVRFCEDPHNIFHFHLLAQYLLIIIPFVSPIFTQPNRQSIYYCLFISLLVPLSWSCKVAWMLGLRLVYCTSEADESIHRCSTQEGSSDLLHSPRPDEAAGWSNWVGRSQRVWSERRSKQYETMNQHLLTYY